MLIFLARSHTNTRFSKKEKQNHEKLLKAIEYIDLHYKEEIKLDELADEVSYSRCYFSSIFKKCMGMSLWDYICIKRIEEALTQIKTTDKNISEIAWQCGFQDESYFYRCYKREKGMSPSKARKLLRD